MLKYLIIIIFLLGAGFGIRPIRARLMPYFAPVIEKLGPVGRKITAPAKRWSTKNEERVLLQKLAEQHADHRELPSPLEFQTWMRIYTHGGNHGLDPWGHPYYLVHENHQITVGSQGPDRLRNTADDVRTSATIQ
jgi:hypothetical protein